jgi:hypothetical protein
VTPLPGDFRVVPVGGAGGKLIELGEWLNGHGFAQYQHAEVFVGSDIGPLAGTLAVKQLGTPSLGYVVRAQPGGAKLALLDRVPGELWSTGRIIISGRQRQLITQASLGIIGTGYSSLDYLALAIHHFGISAPGLQAYISSTNHMICSQCVDWAYLQGGVHLFSDNRWPGYVTPADLAAVIMNWKGT